MFCIPDVERELLIPGQIISPVHLSPSRDTGSERVPQPFTIRIVGQILGQERTRANEAHIPAQDVDQLRKLIEAGSPEYSAERRRPLLVELTLTLTFAIHAHCPEFQQRKEPAIQAWATLTEQHRRSHGRKNGYRHQDHEWTHNHQARGCRDEVYQAFHHQKRRLSSRTRTQEIMWCTIWREAWMSATHRIVEEPT